MMEEAYYRRANNKIHAPEQLKELTLQRMHAEEATRTVRAQETSETPKPAAKVIPLRSSMLRTSLISLAAAAVFFAVGRYVFPSMRSVPVREDVANVINHAESIRIAYAPKFGTGELAGNGFLLLRIDTGMDEIMQDFDLEEMTVEGKTVCLDDVAGDGSILEAYFEKGGSTWMLRAENSDTEALLDALRRLLE